MRRWVRRWDITIRWDRIDNSPIQSLTYQTHVDTAAQLRRFVEYARANPHVVAFPYRSVRDLIGTSPTACRAGHLYPNAGSITRAGHEWAPCNCGGHFVLICHQPGCTDVIVDPDPDPDCDPNLDAEVSARVQRARQRHR